MIGVTRKDSASACGVVAALLALLCFGAPAVADDASAVFIGSFDNPVYIATAPGQRRLLFVVEQPGRIQVLRDEQRLPQPFLDIANLVNFGGERGLLSMAFAPDYASSGLFYVAFNNSTGDVEVDEFQRKAGSNIRADRASRRVLLKVRHRDAGNHNGGQLQFGPKDGLLYISTGDGGEVFPRGEDSRDPHKLLGKILRIDPHPGGGKAYTIPPSNPYVGGGGRAEVFAYGFRNPWRFSFDGPLILIGDVGQGQREEINILKTDDANGTNFGWPQYEGDIFFAEDRPGPDPAMPPMFVYSHNDGGCAVIGGFIVRDPTLPALAGRYVYGDLCTGDIRSFIPHVGPQTATKDRSTGISLPGLTSFGRGLDGTIYLSQGNGDVSRMGPPAP
jgi:glucose/arabinose dehydrogenase